MNAPEPIADAEADLRTAHQALAALETLTSL